VSRSEQLYGGMDLQANADAEHSKFNGGPHLGFTSIEPKGDDRCRVVPLRGPLLFDEPFRTVTVFVRPSRFRRVGTFYSPFLLPDIRIDLDFTSATGSVCDF
jgi:hypothetical protein